MLTVFRLYCMEGLSAAQIARKCKCSRPIVFIRLKLLRRKLGCDPADLRQYSAHFENIEESLADSRARRVYRKGAACGDGESEDDPQ